MLVCGRSECGGGESSSELAGYTGLGGWAGSGCVERLGRYLGMPRRQRLSRALASRTHVEVRVSVTIVCERVLVCVAVRGESWKTGEQGRVTLDIWKRKETGWTEEADRPELGIEGPSTQAASCSAGLPVFSSCLFFSTCSECASLH